MLYQAQNFIAIALKDIQHNMIVTKVQLELLKRFVKKLQICGVFFQLYLSSRETIKFTPALRSLLP